MSFFVLPPSHATDERIPRFSHNQDARFLSCKCATHIPGGSRERGNPRTRLPFVSEAVSFVPPLARPPASPNRHQQRRPHLLSLFLSVSIPLGLLLLLPYLHRIEACHGCVCNVLDLQIFFLFSLSPGLSSRATSWRSPCAGRPDEQGGDCPPFLLLIANSGLLWDTPLHLFAGHLSKEWVSSTLYRLTTASGKRYNKNDTHVVKSSQCRRGRYTNARKHLGLISAFFSFFLPSSCSPQFWT